MDRCSMCQTRKGLTNGVCEKCRKTHALTPPIGSQRPRDPCRRCGHFVLVRVRLRERSTIVGSHVQERPVPMAATFQVDRRRSLWSGDYLHTDLADPIGLMQAYICRKCGFTEIFTASPREIPIGEEYATELVDLTPGKERPFR